MTHSTRKIDNILDGLEKAHGLSSAGRNWLVAAADPFHDFDVPVAGYPDVTTDPSVVQVVKKTFTIKKTPDLAPGLWDVRIDLRPSIASTALGSKATLTPGGYISSTNPIVTSYIGGVTAMAELTGQPIGLDSTFDVGHVDCIEFLSGGPVRLIGAAMEISNTTADIYKQGSVTVYRQPNVVTQRTIWNNRQLVTGTGTYYFSFPVLDSPVPPTTTAAASLLYGSRTWAAEEGAYVVARQNSTINPFKEPNHDFNTLSYLPNDVTRFMYAPGVLTTNSQGNFEPNFPVPYDLSGAYFTGLSEQTTLTVSVRWILERQPVSNVDLLLLVTPSPGYDPLALEIYTRAMGNLPPGCRLSENPLGEWFKKVLTGVKDWAPKIGDALGTIIPGASTIGKIVGGGAGLLMPKDKEKKKVEEVDVVVPKVMLPASTAEAKTKSKTKKGKLGRRIVYKKQ